MKQMKQMMRMLVMALFASSMFTGCVYTPERGYYREEVAPPLPAVVEFDREPYFYQRGYHYRYEKDRWHYARERSGPWKDLPRSHWPREIRHRGEGERGGELRHEQEKR